jgi:hypothetical protein
MTLEKTKELYHDGELVAEVFKDRQFFALLSSSQAYVRNQHYGGRTGNNHVALQPEDFSDVHAAVDEWKKVKDGLWGRKFGGSWHSGHTLTTFYPPYEEEGIEIRKGNSSDHLGVGELEKHVEKGNLGFTFERFCLGISRDNHSALLDRDQIPLLGQVFALYRKRSGLYAPEDEDLDLSGRIKWGEI